MSSISFDLEGVKKNMLAKEGTFKHNTGKRAKLFPFAANDAKVFKMEYDLVDFGGIAAACYRECAALSHKTNFNKAEFIQQACLKASASNPAALTDIIEKVAFDDSGRLYAYDTEVYAYLNFAYPIEALTNIARYITSLLFDDELKAAFRTMAKGEPQNLLYKLLSTSFPPTVQELKEDEHFYMPSETIKAKFKDDFNFLIANNHKYKFVEYFPTLIKFYFFRSVTDLSLELNSFIAQAKKPIIFFSLDWEKLQASRPASNNGWKLFDAMLDSMFIHANTFELLSYINLPIARTGYNEIESFVKQSADADHRQLANTIDQVTVFYKEKNPQVEWANLPLSHNDAERMPVQRAINTLWKSIEYQFTTTKKRQLRAYKHLFVQFAKFNFGKKRGPNGYSLSLKHADVLFLTTLSIGAQDKVRLKDLRKEFEDRGIFLDGISWTHLIDYYEKVNMLEKKSDSGDGQYVKHLN
ncbi:DNA phosphorothioation-dependent restriction protein DptG [Hymenobacter sp. BT186]|uniref:DNA phosphorothioation-dependent restriction protein DptG n=1 Tax=Hymenobacter telluris TaxID=2816474 RepID=A0A939EZT3_9BACT|nr:DNA phosphorothioation-dependent restriction protein DptG [Hymenobacter telluris]MBO0360884.1 DNA phosphorothioation-dependent restriction protein DptG [Hymenobacter telluris]MBW3376913.1 DNA phosphorothioation-dependent restriction protein DptG [Hymenobacter norwichensis]